MDQSAQAQQSKRLHEERQREKAKIIDLLPALAQLPATNSTVTHTSTIHLPPILLDLHADHLQTIPTNNRPYIAISYVHQSDNTPWHFLDDWPKVKAFRQDSLIRVLEICRAYCHVHCIPAVGVWIDVLCVNFRDTNAVKQSIYHSAEYLKHASKVLVFPHGLDLIGPPCLKNGHVAPYYTRLWTYQEALFSEPKKTVHVYCAAHYSSNPDLAHYVRAPFFSRKGVPKSPNHTLNELGLMRSFKFSENAPASNRWPILFVEGEHLHRGIDNHQQYGQLQHEIQLDVHHFHEKYLSLLPGEFRRMAADLPTGQYRTAHQHEATGLYEIFKALSHRDSAEEGDLVFALFNLLRLQQNIAQNECSPFQPGFHDVCYYLVQHFKQRWPQLIGGNALLTSIFQSSTAFFLTIESQRVRIGKPLFKRRPSMMDDEDVDFALDHLHYDVTKLLKIEKEIFAISSKE